MLDHGFCLEVSSHLAKLLKVNEIESFPFRNLHFYINEINQDHAINEVYRCMLVMQTGWFMVDREANLSYRLSGKKCPFLALLWTLELS